MSFELLLKSILKNDKSLENQYSYLGNYIDSKKGSKEVKNMVIKLIDCYTKYQNNNVKHNDKIIEEEIEFILDLTSSF